MKIYFYLSHVTICWFQNEQQKNTQRNNLDQIRKNEQQILTLVKRVHHRNYSGSDFSRAVTLAAISNCHYMRSGACMSSLLLILMLLYCQINQNIHCKFAHIWYIRIFRNGWHRYCWLDWHFRWMMFACGRIVDTRELVHSFAPPTICYIDRDDC